MEELLAIGDALVGELRRPPQIILQQVIITTAVVKRFLQNSVVLAAGSIQNMKFKKKRTKPASSPEDDKYLKLSPMTLWPV